MQVIDFHTHIVVPQILRVVTPDETWRPAISWQDGQQVIDFMGKQIRSAVREFVHIEYILEAQAKAGVTHTVLAPWVSLVRYNTPPDEGLRVSGILNDALSALATTYASDVSALGSVPMQDPELAAAELRKLMAETQLKGVQIAASVNGTYLGDAQFEPFWQTAEETGALVFIHPTTRGFQEPVFNEYYLWNTVGNPMETAITAAHMTMAGVMERFPGLKVILAHGGGALMAVRGRLCHSYSFQPQARAVLQHSPEESLKRFYYDSLTHDAGLLLALIDFVGADHIVVGSDYPFDMGSEKPAAVVEALDVSPDMRDQITFRTASGLLKLS